MNVVLLNERTAEEAGRLAYTDHRDQRARYPWLPEKMPGAYADRIRWMVREGAVFSLCEGKTLLAFLGYFRLDDLRNEGPGAFTPDWCLGAARGSNAQLLLRILERELLAELSARGIGLHCASVPAFRDDYREAFDLSGYGRIVMDAARPAAELLGELAAFEPEDSRIAVRRAGAGDGAALAPLAFALAEHIGRAPVLMPHPRGLSAAGWEEWLAKPGTAAFLALRDGEPAGYIRAEEPQDDVTFAVHGPSTLAINGLFVRPELRGKDLGRVLLRALVLDAADRGKEIVSVDCETTNPEAYGFWTRHFIPVAWSMERRFNAGGRNGRLQNLPQ